MLKSDAIALLFRWFLMIAGSIISAIGVIVFMTPFDIAPMGFVGVAVILNIVFALPIGLTNFALNVPLMIWAARMLGGWRVVAWTIVFIVIYSISLDTLSPFFPAKGVSDDVLLNAIFGGIIGGVGAAMVIRAGGTTGGVSTLGRVLQEKYGIPLSTTYLYSNVGVILLIGAVLGWEGALFAMVAIGVEGAMTDYLLEGPSVIRVAMVITD
ncbi:MAG: YitT family protein, partial [Anaerolineae bacterium]|nr:YitT family protein [Anaerolineae bacterium]